MVRILLVLRPPLSVAITLRTYRSRDQAFNWLPTRRYCPLTSKSAIISFWSPWIVTEKVSLTSWSSTRNFPRMSPILAFSRTLTLVLPSNVTLVGGSLTSVMAISNVLTNFKSVSISRVVSCTVISGVVSWSSGVRDTTMSRPIRRNGTPRDVNSYE